MSKKAKCSTLCTTGQQSELSVPSQTSIAYLFIYTAEDTLKLLRIKLNNGTRFVFVQCRFC